MPEPTLIARLKRPFPTEKGLMAAKLAQRTFTLSGFSHLLDKKKIYINNKECQMMIEMMNFSRFFRVCKVRQSKKV